MPHLPPPKDQSPDPPQRDEGHLPSLKDVAPIIAALILAGAGWLTFTKTADKERAANDYQRKEVRYAALVSSSIGFHGGGSAEEKRRFLNELNLCWLYCSDTVIRDAYIFLSSVEMGAAASDEKDRAKKLGTLMLEIRRDLLTRQAVTKTELQPEEFRILRANE